MNKTAATCLGFLVAPVVPTLLFAFNILDKFYNHSAVFSEVLVSFVIFYLYSVTVGFIFGLPLYLVAYRINRITWWSALLAGALVGVVVSVIFHFGNESVIDALLKNVPTAMIAGFVFWLIWKRGK